MKELVSYLNARFPGKEAFQILRRLIYHPVPAKTHRERIVFNHIKNNVTVREAMLKDRQNFPGWLAVKWAKWVGNKSIMIDLVKGEESAVLWAVEVGDKDIMKSKITSERAAFLWAVNVGDEEEMAGKIESGDTSYQLAKEIQSLKTCKPVIDILAGKVQTEPVAYQWLSKIGHDERMMSLIQSEDYAQMLARERKELAPALIGKIFSSRTAYMWALEVGNRDVMIGKINSEETALLWAMNIGDRELMESKIVSERWAVRWATEFGSTTAMASKVKSEEMALEWAINVGDWDVMVSKIRSNKIKALWNDLVRKDFEV